MLQIKKKAELIQCKYNLKFLFRKSGSGKDYILQKQKTTSVILRSPKHFNIGKQKITNLNFKTPSLSYFGSSLVYMTSLVKFSTPLYKIAVRFVKTTPVLGITSIRVSVRAKFKLMWLEI